MKDKKCPKCSRWLQKLFITYYCDGCKKDAILDAHNRKDEPLIRDGNTIVPPSGRYFHKLFDLTNYSSSYIEVEIEPFGHDSITVTITCRSPIREEKSGRIYSRTNHFTLDVKNQDCFIFSENVSGNKASFIIRSYA